MPRYNLREHTRVGNPQVLNSVHAQERVDDAAVLQRRHARGTRGVVQRLHTLACDLLKLGVGEAGHIVVQLRVFVACGIDDGRERLGAGDFGEEAHAKDERFDVVGVGEVAEVVTDVVRNGGAKVYAVI